MRYLVAADTGGTFTDIVVYDAATKATQFGKTLTTYTDLVSGVLEGLGETTAELSETTLFKHGTTLVINSLVQRKGARTALVTTRGFRDILEIARGNRAVPFQHDYRRDPPLIPRHLRFEVTERISADGSVLEPLDRKELELVAEDLRSRKIEAVAVSFLNAYRNPVHEREAEAALRDLLPDVFVTTGTALSQEWSEYERTSTVAANGFVGARMEGYIRHFDTQLRSKKFDGALYMMGSNGGVMSVAHSLLRPVALVESGPIGGCIGAGVYARALGIDRMVAFDMGGTTAKCAIVEDGKFAVQSTYFVGGYARGFPLRTPVLDIVEVGAGGGSIAWLDGNGRLQLGPHSAGSDPGPVAFRRGGAEPTVTDANVVLNRINSDSFLGGRLKLDVDGSARAIRDKLAGPMGYNGLDGVERVAQGILDLALVSMTSAIKEITAERGRDVRDYVLFVFGGGGPLFGSELARNLMMSEVIVPPHPGNFSSLGMLLSDARFDLAQTLVEPVEDVSTPSVRQTYSELEQRARSELADDFDRSSIVFQHEAEIRYRGQKHTVRVAIDQSADAAMIFEEFERAYRRRFGHINEGCAAEFIALRVVAFAPIPAPNLQQVFARAAGSRVEAVKRQKVYFGSDRGHLDTPVYARNQLPEGFRIEGPAIIQEFSSTTVLSPGDVLTVGALGELRIRCPLPLDRS